MLDILGKIYSIQENPEDSENPIVTEKAGWHVNSLTELDGLDEYRVYPFKAIVDGVEAPKHPRRLFAGVKAEDTFFYSFPDQTTAEELLAPWLPVMEEEPVE